MQPTTIWKIAGLVLFFSLLPSDGISQSTPWEQEMDAGRKEAALGRPAEAIQSFKAALQKAESSRDEERLGASLTELGLAYSTDGQYAEAEPILQRAVAVKEKLPGPGELDFAHALLDLGALYRMKGESDKAEPPIRRALGILEKTLGPEHPEVGGTLTNLGGRLRDQGKFAEAEPLLKRALALRENMDPPDDINLVKTLLGLASFYSAQEKYADAEPLLTRAVELLEKHKAYGTAYPNLPDALVTYSELLRKMNRQSEATEIEIRGKDLREKYPQ